MTSALQTHGVSVARAGRTVVREVDLEIPAGQVTALLGANGAGKSSLVLGLAGIVRFAGGHVSLDGRELTARTPHRIRAAGIATVPEGHRILAALTVRDHLRVAGSRLSKPALAAAVEQALATFPELAERQEQRSGTLSGGQQQMLSIASALVGQPRFLLIDELSLGLAPAVVRRLGPVIREIAASGIGVLLIEQFATVALALADRANVMDRGRIVFSGTAQQLTAQPELLQGAYLTAPDKHVAVPADSLDDRSGPRM
jgi:branched-chain amino acid transport system ATP-binding protein